MQCRIQLRQLMLIWAIVLAGSSLAVSVSPRDSGQHLHERDGLLIAHSHLHGGAHLHDALEQTANDTDTACRSESRESPDKRRPTAPEQLPGTYLPTGVAFLSSEPPVSYDAVAPTQSAIATIVAAHPSPLRPLLTSDGPPRAPPA